MNRDPTEFVSLLEIIWIRTWDGIDNNNQLANG